MIYEKTRRYIIPFEDVPSPRAEMPEISVDERRGNFTEVETGFPEDMAIQEAKRCLSCRRCLGCALCWAECQPEAINFDIPDETLDLEFDEVILTRGQDNAFYPFSDELGFGDFPQVITDLQFERMLSPTGPTDGLVVSPLDGEIPGRIALIQGHPGDEEDHLLSSVTFGVNEALFALHGTKDLEVSLVSPLCNAFKEQHLGDAEKIKGLTLVDGAPTAVKSGNGDGTLTLSYAEGGKEKSEEFDMVVVLTKPKISPEILSLSKKLEQDII